MHKLIATILLFSLSIHVASAQQTYALLVGVGNYLTPAECADKSQVAMPDGIKPLRCPTNDVQLFQSVLNEKFALADGGAMVLLHEKATRTAVIDGLRAYADRCRPEDTFVFYYSGHGAQLKNSKSTEVDKMDEVLLPYDAVLKGKLIRDKEIRDLLSAITAKGTEVIALFDCCHSGSMTRDVTYESKAIPTIEAEIEWSAPSAVRGDDNKLVVFSAAQSDELATARADAEGRMTSLFTQGLVSALKKAKGNESLDQMLNVCQQYMDDLKVVQHPVLDANATRRKRSLSGVELNQAGLVVQQLLAGKRATVYGADVLNMSVGSSVCDLAGTACAKVLRIVNPTEAEVQFSPSVKILPPFGTSLRISSLATDEAKLKIFFSRSIAEGRTQEFTSVVREFEQKLQAYANANKAELSLTDSARADYLIHLVSGSQASSWVLERIHGTGEG
ncbi:MAG: caspase domain-containing protein, partial [Flavobacteriales bacterium]